MSISLQWLGPHFPELSNITRLNAGGQKEVFAADHVRDGAIVLKIIHPHQDVESIDRELLAVKQVQSSRVPTILESGQITTPLGQCYWFREQRIVGPTVRELVKNQRFSEVELIRLALHVLEALVCAESAKIVHRDVKPDNIIRDAANNYWLLDFGIARHLDLASLTASANHFGKFTLGYAPPEQFRNLKREIDSRSDLFGLGVTLFECYTKTHPFRDGASSELEIIKRVERNPLPPLQLSCKDSQNFSDLISCMTQKRRENRPFTAKDAHMWILDIAHHNGIS